jgi:hypothetical protein
MRLPGPVIIVCVGWILVSIGSCGEKIVGSGVIVTDSAGIEIVQHPPDAEVPLWALMDEPHLEIGVVWGDPRYEFANVADVLWDDDGRILVLDRSQRRISVFGPDGAFISASGREGEGPGEYQSPSAIWRIPGDSLAMYDPPLGRVSVLDKNAHFVRSIQVRPIRTLVLPSGSLEDGRLLVVNPFPDPTDYGLATSYTVSTEGIDSLGVFRQIENQAPGPMSSVTRPLVAKVRRLRASGTWLYVIRNTDHELLIQDPNGELRRIIRWYGPDLTATRATNQRYIEDRVARAPEERRSARRAAFGELRPNESYPPFEWLKADREGRAWLQAYRQPFEIGPTEWRVVSPRGELLGRLDLPEDAVVLDANDEYVLLLLRDKLGVASVALYGLDRGDRP